MFVRTTTGEFINVAYVVRFDTTNGHAKLSNGDGVVLTPASIKELQKDSQRIEKVHASRSSF
jgi:hypothetical protein